MAGPNAKGSAEVAIYKKNDSLSESEVSPSHLKEENGGETVALWSAVESSSSEQLGESDRTVSSQDGEVKDKSDGGAGKKERAATSAPASLQLPSPEPKQVGAPADCGGVVSSIGDYSGSSKTDTQPSMQIFLIFISPLIPLPPPVPTKNNKKQQKKKTQEFINNNNVKSGRILVFFCCCF